MCLSIENEFTPRRSRAPSPGSHLRFASMFATLSRKGRGFRVRGSRCGDWHRVYLRIANAAPPGSLRFGRRDRPLFGCSLTPKNKEGARNAGVRRTHGPRRLATPRLAELVLEPQVRRTFGVPRAVFEACSVDPRWTDLGIHRWWRTAGAPDAERLGPPPWTLRGVHNGHRTNRAGCLRRLSRRPRRRISATAPPAVPAPSALERAPFVGTGRDVHIFL